MHQETVFDLKVDRHGDVTRRRFFQLAGASLATSGILGQVSLNAAQLKKDGRACILIWLAGGPSQMETWDPKPGTENGGETKAIRTAVPSIKIAEYFPKIAKTMKDIAIIRSMSGREAAHARATYRLRTGRLMGGPEKHPHFGSIVAQELGNESAALPNFVSIGNTLSSGFLGVKVAPFVVNRAGQLPANVSMTVPRARMNRRLALLNDQEQDFSAAGAKTLVEEHQTLYERAAKLMKSPKLKAFQFVGESEKMQNAYGKTQLGQGCLIARRLVEQGVPFVEVVKGGWDMHNDTFQRFRNVGPEVDSAVSQLILDLKQRGLLKKTLVLCMGEFGRTPKINTRPPIPGRDHWSKNFNLLMAGGGVKGGRAIGRTSKDGQEIADRKVSVEELFQSWCHALKIDPDYEMSTPVGRPLKVVDGGTVVKELFS